MAEPKNCADGKCGRCATCRARLQAACNRAIAALAPSAAAYDRYLKRVGRIR